MTATRTSLGSLLAGIPEITLLAEAEADALVGKAIEDANASFAEDPRETIAEVGASCLALGPVVRVVRGAARHGAPRPAAWWARDGKLFLSCSVAADPLLWVEVEPSAEGVRHALGELSPRGDAPEKVHRFFFGLMSDFVEGFMALENQLTLSVYCDGLPLRLGSAAPADGRTDCFDDPEHTSTFETLLSKSRITISAIHTLLESASIAIGVIEYRPAPHSSVVAAWNAARGSDFPLDMPLDVLGAVSSGVGISLSQLEGSVVSGELLPPDLSLLVATTVLTASGPNVVDEAELAALLRRHMTNAEGSVRVAVGGLADMYGCASVVSELRAAEQDPAVRAALDERIA